MCVYIYTYTYIHTLKRAQKQTRGEKCRWTRACLTITRHVGRKLPAHVTSEEDTALQATLNAEKHDATREGPASAAAASAGEASACNELSVSMIRMPVISDKKALDDIVK